MVIIYNSMLIIQIDEEYHMYQKQVANRNWV